MNKDQIKGGSKQVVGKVKEKAGQVSGNRDLENKGKVVNITGRIQSGYGDIKNSIDKQD